MTPRTAGIRGGIVAAGALLFGLAACDPCDGVASCEEAPAFRADGQIIRHATGDPAAGVELEFRWRDGTGVERPSVTTVTNADGHYHVEIPAAAEGPARFDVLVTPPGGDPSYEAPGIRLRSSRTRGEGTDLGRWTSSLYLPVLVILRPAYQWESGCLARLTEGTEVTFRQTGGVEIPGGTSRSVRVETAQFLLDVKPAGRGIVEGEVIVTHPGGQVQVSGGIRVAAEFRDTPHTGVPVILGPSLNYSGQVFWNAIGGEAIHPATVEFRRTSGIEVCPDHFEREVQPWGGFSMVMATVQEGRVVGDLIVHPEGFPPDTIRDVSIPTSSDFAFTRINQWVFPKP